MTMLPPADGGPDGAGIVGEEVAAGAGDAAAPQVAGQHQGGVGQRPQPPRHQLQQPLAPQGHRLPRGGQHRGHCSIPGAT